MVCSKNCTIADKLLTIETGKLANQTESSVTVRYGDTVVLVTLCVGDERPGESDFVQLTVDYEERHYAVGKIPGSFIRREGRPGEQATLTARLTDRSLRPLLSKGFNKDIQIVVTVLSTDQENAPDILAVIGASACLMLSSIPFDGPVAGVHVGYINDQLVLNPALPQMNDSLIDVVVVSTKEAVLMIEAEAQEASEKLILEAIEFGHVANQEMIRIQEELGQDCGKPKIEMEDTGVAQELAAAVSSDYGDKLAQAVIKTDRDERKEAVALLKTEIMEKFKDSFPEAKIADVIDAQLKKAARRNILETRKHLDGRENTQIRPLSCEVGILPRTHGSGLFARGQTQVLAITTLGSLRQEQLIDDLGLEGTKRFMHHYNFPPFSTGEAKRVGTTTRREIGHGALAEKALFQVIPKEENFAYTIRIVSEVLSSNGSTSMASVCSSTLSLMDAGVPIKAPVAGIAIGLVTAEDGDYVVLTDIEGLEDAYGDMDFKVAGTNEGITAIQLDIKLQGISLQILTDALKQARDARLEILDNIKKAIDSSRPELSPYAPRVYRINIDPAKIGTVIGPGGKTIRSITDETKVSMDVNNDGMVTIGSANEEAARRAIEMVENLTREIEVGVIYTGTVTRITNFGAFVEVLPGKEGLVHISELADHHVSKVEDVVDVGDEIMVKVTDIDHLGRVNLSRRAIFGDSSGERKVRVADSTSTNRPYQKRPRPQTGDRRYDNRNSRYRQGSKR